MTDEPKVCTKCKTPLPATEAFFYKDPRKPGGLRSWCKRCINRKDREYARANPERTQERKKVWRKKNPEKAKAWDQSPTRRNWRITWEEKNRPRRNLYYKNLYLKLRSEVHAAYGNSCSCCGETDSRFLTVEHIERDGASHRRALGGAGGPTYRFLKKNGYPKDKFTLLCMNCNWATRFGDPCPHVERKKHAA